jgi:predicted metalloprotease
MRLDGGRRSTNVEDRRGMGVPLVAGGGIGTVIIALLYYFLTGGTPATMQQEQQRAPDAQVSKEDAQLGEFVSVVLADTEDVWHDIFRNELGKEYVDPKLVLFSQYVQSACGLAQSATGPFYCPLDQKVYIDLSFYREMKDRFAAPGDFAQAYVIAHEVGHHVQNQLGISDQVHAAQERSSQTEANALSVRLELQADCLAGVWANHAQKMRNILEPGDIEEALNAASAIGDDRLQKETRGYVSPDSFTHGSSAQRVHWFKQGFESGQMGQCETFKDSRL